MPRAIPITSSNHKIEKDINEYKQNKNKSNDDQAIKEVSDYKCPNCNKQFKDRSNYHKHMKLYETTKYSCDKCDKSYTVKGNLNQHIKTHDIPEVATCSKCNKVFATITSFKIHMKNVHSESKEDIAQVTHFSSMYRTFVMWKNYLKD